MAITGVLCGHKPICLPRYWLIELHMKVFSNEGAAVQSVFLTVGFGAVIPYFVVSLRLTRGFPLCALNTNMSTTLVLIVI